MSALHVLVVRSPIFPRQRQRVRMVKHERLSDDVKCEVRNQQSLHELYFVLAVARQRLVVLKSTPRARGHNDEARCLEVCNLAGELRCR